MPLLTAVDFFPLHPGDDFEFEDGGQKVKTEERVYSERLAARIEGSRTEVRCDYGSIDVLTPTEVIEVKRLSDWKGALGQAIAYGFAYPKRKKRIHLLIPASQTKESASYELERIAEVCKSVGVSVSAEREIEEKVVIKTAVYRVGQETFTDMAQITARISQFKETFSQDEPLDQAAEQFIVDIVNSAHWTEKRLGGMAVKARIIGRITKAATKRQTFSFQVKSENGAWTSISMKNYLAQVESLGEVNFQPTYQRVG